MSADSFEEYRERRRLWRDCLGSDDKHGLWAQVWRVTFNAAVYRTVNRAIELAPAASEGGRQLNGMVFDLFHDAFFESTLIRVRRLAEVEPHGIDKGPRAVYSLGTLLKDMEDHAHLMTMENVLLMEAERDSDEWWRRERREHMEVLLRQTSGGKCASVPRSFFVTLRGRMNEKTRKLADYVDKYIAHAASPESRATVSQDGPSFLDVMAALRVIHETAEFASVYLLDGTSHGRMPIVSFDQFAYLDRPLAPGPETLEDLRDLWKRTEQEVSAWTLGLDELVQELWERQA